jgi:sugar phosphate isomerase/epimerase
MKISISTGSFYKYNFTEILEIISHTDCKNIELCLNIESLVSVPVMDIIKEIEKKKMKVLSIHAPFYYMYKPGEDERFWISRCVELAEMLNANVVISHDTIRKESPIILDEQHKANLIEFNGLQRENAKSLHICAENFPMKKPTNSFLSNHDELLGFIAEYNIPLTFDTAHWATHGLDIIEGYRYFKDYIKNIHISDFADGIEHKILGTGNLPIKEFVRALQADGYNKPLTVELDLDNPKRNPISNKQEAIDGLNASLQLIYDSLKRT